MRRWTAVFALVVLVGIGVYILVSIVWAGRFVTSTIGKVTGNIVNASGLSPWLVKGLVVIATVPFFWAVAKYSKSWWGFSPLRANLNLYLNRYGVIIVLYVGAYFLAVYFASRDSFVGLDGKPTKYCAETPEGIRVFDSPGVDPVYGVTLRPCTDGQIRALRKELLAIPSPRPVGIDDPRSYAFFDGVSGRPNVWYYRRADGHLDLYDRGGSHPGTGKPLSPINEEVIEELVRLQEEERAEKKAAEVDRQRREAAQREAEAAQKAGDFIDRYVNPGARNSPDELEVGVAQVSEPIPASLEQALQDKLRALGMSAVGTLVRPAFAADGLAQALGDGDMNVAARLRLSQRVDALVLVDVQTKVKANPEYAGASTASIRLDLHCVQVVQLRACGTLHLRAVGIGFSGDAATANAVEKLLPELANRLAELNP